MSAIHACSLPPQALLAAYLGSGAYTDCYCVDIPQAVSQEQYVTAFYSTAVFRLERFILKWLVARPSTDQQARQLAAGTLDTFAAWTVEKRTDRQLLLCDFLGRTRSWLMSVPLDGAGGTRLYFGSAVVPRPHSSSGQRVMVGGFSALRGFHQLYSRVLIGAAARRMRSAA